MEERTIQITHKNNNKIKFGVIPGHFATPHSHVSAYIAMNRIKNKFISARDAAKEIAANFYGTTPVDAIITLEGTRMIGAFIAEELYSGMRGINSGNDIAVITPEFDMNNQIILRDNIIQIVKGKHCLLLVSSVSSGKSVYQAMECLNYYGSELSGVAALFTAVDEVNGIPIHALFHEEDIPKYTTHKPADCPMCKAGQKIDAIVNTFGYSKI